MDESGREHDDGMPSKVETEICRVLRVECMALTCLTLLVSWQSPLPKRDMLRRKVMSKVK